MARPERGDRAAAEPQRLGSGAPARRKRAQEGRADPAQARDDADRARRQRKGADGCSASWRRADGRDIAIEAKKGVVIATGGHTGNVNFRRMFDPRLTEEYQQAGLPYSFQGADGELAAMDIGASLWATGTQTTEVGPAITKTRHVGTRWGYLSLYFETDSPIFHLCKATGLTVTDWQEAILVNQNGQRFWNELDSSYDYLDAAMGYHGDTNKLQRRRADLGDLRRRRGGAAEVEAASRRTSTRRLFLQRRHDLRAGRPDQEPVPEAADRGRRAAGDGEPLQFVRRVGRRCRLRQADAAASDRQAAVLRGVVDADPARLADRACAPTPTRRWSTSAARSIPGSIARANPRAASPSTGSAAAWCSAASPAATRRNAIREERAWRAKR